MTEARDEHATGSRPTRYSPMELEWMLDNWARSTDDKRNAAAAWLLVQSGLTRWPQFSEFVEVSTYFDLEDEDEPGYPIARIRDWTDLANRIPPNFGLHPISLVGAAKSLATAEAPVSLRHLLLIASPEAAKLIAEAVLIATGVQRVLNAPSR
jgi:hypothetical protein